MHNFLEVVVGGKVITLETEPESATVARLNLQHAEFLYPVGSKSVRMFRVAEGSSKNIYTIKIASLVMSDPLTYQPFLACVKEALLLSKKINPKHNLLSLRGYFLVSRRTFRFWDSHIDLILMFEDHDMTLLDLIRARKLSKAAWPKDYAQHLLNDFSSQISECQKAYDFTFLYFNPLNLVYSKATQKFLLANFNNIFLASELDRIKEVQGTGMKLQFTPESFFSKIFPEISRLYSSSEHREINDQTNQFSLSIIGLQLAEICLQGESTGKEIVQLLDEKLGGKVTSDSLRQSRVLQKSLGSLGNRLIESLKGHPMDSQANNLVPKSPSKQMSSPSMKLESEIKVVNSWKDLMRSLSPDYNHVKYLHESHLFLVAGNAKKAITSCKKAIEEFTKVKDLDVMDWISLVEFLVNAFMRLNVQDQAKYHAANLLQYIQKAVSAGRMPQMLGKIDTLSLKTIINDPIELLEERDQWGLSRIFEECLSFHIYYLGLDSPDRLAQFIVHKGTDDCFLARSFNFDILYKLYLGQLEGLHSKIKRFQSFLDTSNLSQKKRTLFLSNISIAFYILGEFSESIRVADHIMVQIKELDALPKVVLAADQPAEVFNNLGVFYSMKGGDYLKSAEHLFLRAEKAVRLSKNSSHKNLLTILNNLAIFYYSQKNLADSKRIADEVHQHIKRETTKKPLYLINIAALMYKRGEYHDANKVIDNLKELVNSEEGVHYFDLDNLKRIFLLSSLNQVRLKRLKEFEADIESYRSLLGSREEEFLAHSKTDRMKAIGLLKLGQVDRARMLLESCS